MTAAVPFDTLELARKLEAAGFPTKQAQDTAAALAGVMGQELATKQDIRDLDTRLGHQLELLRRDLEALRRDLTIRLGGMIAAGVVVVGVLVGLF